MNSFVSAAVLAQNGVAVNHGFMALALVQALGVILAIGMTYHINEAHAREIPKTWHSGMMKIVWGVLVMTILVAACQEDVGPQIWTAFGGALPGPTFLYWFDLDSAHQVYFLVDFGALAFLIYATGGPQQSLYATFLSVIVPISIALGSPSIETVVAFAAITMAIFLTLLYVKPPKYFEASENGNRSRRLWLGLVTTACVVFPTLVFCIQNWKPGTQTPPTVAPRTSTLPQEREDVAVPGDRGTDSVAEARP